MAMLTTDKKDIKLSDKQEAFCLEYIVDLNATQAAIRAKYSEKTAYSQGQRLLKHVEVQRRISELKSSRVERVEINADYVLNRLVEIDQMDVIDILDDIGQLLPISVWPKSWRRYISAIDINETWVQQAGEDSQEVQSAIIKKIKWPDKIKNLELIGKHTTVQAWKDNVELSGTVTNVQMTPEEYRKARQEMLENDDC